MEFSIITQNSNHHLSVTYTVHIHYNLYVHAIQSYVPSTVMDLDISEPLLVLLLPVLNLYSPGVLSVTVSVCLTVEVLPLRNTLSPCTVELLSAVVLLGNSQ